MERHEAQGITCFNETSDNEWQICISTPLLENILDFACETQPAGPRTVCRAKQGRAE